MVHSRAGSPILAVLLLAAFLEAESFVPRAVQPIAALAKPGRQAHSCPVRRVVVRRAESPSRWAVSMGATREQGEQLLGLLQEGGQRQTVLEVGQAMSQSASPPVPTEASGEWELFAGDGAAAKLEGCRVVIDWEKGIVQTIEGLTTRVLKVLETKGSDLSVVEVTKRVMSVITVDEPETAPRIKLRVVHHSPNKALILTGELEGRSFMAVLKSRDPARRIKPWDLPGYFEGFLTDERVKQEGANAAALDNLTPNIKLGVGVTLALTAAVAAFVVANPPPSKDQPLPTRSAAPQAVPAADAANK